MATPLKSLRAKLRSLTGKQANSSSSAGTHTGVTPLKFGSRFSKLTALFLIVAVVAAASYLLTRSRAALVAPTEPPARICGNASILDGPATAPAGAVVVPAGDNSTFFQNESFKGDNAAGTVYWFEPGTHTLGTSIYGQVIAIKDATYIGAPGAILDGQGINHFAFTQKATGVIIKHLTIQNFVSPMDQGVVNHDAATGWTIEYNTIHNNKAAGVFMGDNNIVRYNCLKDNGQYGYQGYGDTILLDHNEIVGNNTDDWESKIGGCGCTGAGKFWAASHATITNNWVHDNKSVGIWADNNNFDFLIEGNYINDNDSHGIMYETSYNAVIRHNTLKNNTLKQGRANANSSFPQAAIYVSESGGDARVSSRVTGTSNLEIYGNVLENNWAGIALWENADRYCGSPNETSTNTCTLGNPAPTIAECASGHFFDGATTAGSTTFTSNKAGFYGPYDIGKAVNSANLPAGTTITGLTSYTQATLSQAATASGTNLEFTIEGRSPTNAIERDPLYWHCRHRTQNVKVHNNTFKHDPAAIGCTNTFCGRNAIFSQPGSSPAWSPYKGDVIQQAITYNQGNVFSNNSYIGPWRFLAYDMGNELYFTSWQSAPFNQDIGSTFDSPPANYLDSDTATIEGSKGLWQPWYSTSVSRSTETSHGGAASLRIDITNPNGWGVQTTAAGGLAAGPGPKTLSFWSRLGSGTSLGASFRVRWLDSTGAVLQTDIVRTYPLTTTWQQATADIVAPAGTAKFLPELYEALPASGTTGNYLFVDDMVLIDQGGSTAPPPPPPSDATAPTASITAPAGGSTVSGNTSVTATASDNVGVTKVELYIDGKLTAADIAAPYSFSWNTAGFTNGSHTLAAKAYDAAGNVGSSPAVTVTVNNLPPPGPKPGDVNGDGKLDIFDLRIIGQNWQLSGRTRGQGDLNGDGVVNIFDLRVIGQNWGT
ncbi:right-handed parallel beta-helix repeat-containing protein [Candidatus Parcubacteria bacterium]|nr:right-handed parallel beta-helix repeat-containing protein [Candidatus Parcubacteria bacterium]